MVSPAPSAPQKPPVLSYADRAKKARNINSHTPLAVHPQSSTLTSTPATEAPVPAVVVPSPIPDLNTSKESSVGHINNRLPQPTQPTSLSADVEIAPKDSNESNLQHVNSPPTTSPDHSQRPSVAPTINVWHKRKEEMAQAQARAHPQPRHPATTRPQESQESTSSRSSELFSSNGVTTSRLTQQQNVNGNGFDGHNPKAPSNVQQLQTAVSLAVDDATSWPAVGMSVSAPTATQHPPNKDGAGSGEGKAVKADELKGKDDEKNGSGVPSKKSEKPKWIQMPREELQAAADEHRHRSSPRSTGHSRSRPSQQHNQYKTSQGSKSASGSVSNASASGQNSQGQSRAHSAAGTRTQQSHPSSASHSQAESRVGSVQSSPRQQSSSRGTRRLPDDGIPRQNTDSAGPRNRSIKSSRAASPQVTVRSIQATEMPSPAASKGNERSQVAADSLQPYPEPNHIHGEPYYSIVPPPLSSSNSQPHSYHSTQVSNSPVASSYGLPPVAPPSNMYPSPPPNIPGYAGTSPYPMYPQYGFPHYGQTQAYMPWTASGQGQGNLYPVSSQFHHSRSPSNQSAYSPAPIPVANQTRDMQQHEGVPPPTMMSRPPPPGQSEGVAGYREVGFFSQDLSAHIVAPEGSEPDAIASRGRQAREFSFGTIKHTVANKTPSPPPTSQQNPVEVEETNADFPEEDISGQEGEGGEKAFPVFSIGVNPGEAGPSRIRSKTHPKSTNPSHERGNTAPARLGASHYAEGGEDAAGPRELSEEPKDAQTSVIDLTDSVMPTWEFGTTKQSNGDEARPVESPSSEVPRPVAQLNGTSAGHTRPDVNPSFNISTVPHVDVISPLPSIPRPPHYIPHMEVSPLSVGMPNGLPLPPAHSPSALYPQSGVSMISPSGDGRVNDEWEVRNFGYGFGRGGSGGPGPHMGGRMDRERDFSPREYNPGRPRRGSYGGGYGYDRGGHERGGYVPRRGRGVNGGYGGRGFGGRNVARGQSQRPPFTATQQPVVNPTEAGFYAPPPPQGTTFFHPLGYDYAAYPYAPLPMTTPTSSSAVPPVPTPQSVLSFPLDPTRYYLLGQLEYYLSAQNLAQDFYLRQRMDSRGWIPIPLIASFNRIKQLTTDLQLVKDVLTLSSLVEVHGEFVRVRPWQQYVLPTAAQSTVEDEYTYQSYAHPDYEEAVSSASGEPESTSHDGDDEDVSEEEVEFVMGQEAHGTWTPERNTATSTTPGTTLTS